MNSESNNQTLIHRSVSQSTASTNHPSPDGLWGVSPGDDVSSLTSASQNLSCVSENDDDWGSDDDEDCWIHEEDLWSDKRDTTTCSCIICQGHALSQDAFLEAVSTDRQLPSNVRVFTVVESVCENRTWLVVAPPHPLNGSTPTTTATTACFLIQHTFISVLKSIRAYYSCANTAPILPPSMGSIIMGVDSVDNDGSRYINCYLSTHQFDISLDLPRGEDLNGPANVYV